MGDIVHRYPGFLPVSAVSMAEHDGFGGVLGRDIPSIYISFAVNGVERDILVIHIFSKLGIGVQRSNRRIRQNPCNIGMKRNKTENKEKRQIITTLI